MKQYVVLNKDGEVVTLIMTNKLMRQLRPMWPDCRIVPIELVPDEVLETYPKWRELV